MSLRTTLQLTQSTRLAMTPTLRQAIRVLQLSAVELDECITEEVGTNPLLVLEDGAPEPVTDADAVQTTSGETGAEGALPFDDPAGVEPTEREASLFTWSQTPARDNDDEGDSYERIAQATTLAEHLLDQLSCICPAGRGRSLASWLIGNLNDDGILEDPLEECAKSCPIEASAQEWADALAMVRRLDPAGVGAESRSGILLLQLERQLSQGDGSEAGEIRLAMSLIREFCTEIARRDFKKPALRLGTTTEAVAGAFHRIENLDPHPTAAFADVLHTGCIIPEILVTRSTKGWIARLNPQTVPQLRFDHESFELLTAAKLDPSSRESWKQKAQGAKAFVHAIEQRFSTITAVAQAIVDAQAGFFERGPAALTPMVLRDVADSLGMAESTVSRATAGKYMQTPRGTYELKYFFTSGLAADNGTSVSSEAVKNRILSIVANEDPASPLSDSAIAGILADAGIQVARRTVTKYREATGIAPKALRRRTPQ